MAGEAERAVSPKRILFFSHYFPPEGNAPATRVFELCRRWVTAGHSVTVVTGVPNVPNGVIYDGYHNRWRQIETLRGIRVVRVWTYVAANRGTFRRIANFISFMLTASITGLFLPRPDIVIATSPQFFCGWAGVIVSKLRRLPFILEIRDLWPESIEAVGALRSGSLFAFLEWLERRLYAAADGIVTVGDGYRRKLLEKGVAERNISVVMNGVDREYFGESVSGAAVRREYGLDGAFVCSYIGTVGMACGLEVVLRAGRLLQERGRNVKFLIVGDGAVMENLKRVAAEQGLDNVVFSGRQPREMVPQFVAASDVCLVHLKKQRLFETVMPSKIFEALAMAKPVILGVQGFAAEFLRSSGGGICIEPENETELLSAIDRLEGDPEGARSMGVSGRDFVHRHFDRDALAAKYLDVILRVQAGALRTL